MTAGEEEQQRRIAKGHKETLGNYGHVCNLIMVVVSQAYTCVKSCQIVHLKYRQFIVFNFTSVKLFLKTASEKKKKKTVSGRWWALSKYLLN